MSIKRLHAKLNPWLNRRIKDREVPDGPATAQEQDWSRYGVTGELLNEPDAPAVDELLLIRFMMQVTDAEESRTVREHLRQFSAWREWVLTEEQREREAFARKPADDDRDCEQVASDYRHFMFNALSDQPINLLKELVLGRHPKDLPGGPPVDENLLRMVVSDPVSASFIDTLFVARQILTYRAWNNAFREHPSET